MWSVERRSRLDRTNIGRSSIETVNSQLESMGLQRLHARFNAGRELKVHASLLAPQPLGEQRGATRTRVPGLPRPRRLVREDDATP